jgi:GNAT superfamily N-acetyltransferase
MAEPFDIVELDGSDDDMAAFVHVFRSSDVMMDQLTVAGMRRWEQMTGAHLQLLARREGEVVGAAGIYAQPNDPDSTTLPMQLAIVPDDADTGIRRALVDQLWAWARERCTAPRCIVGVDERSGRDLACWAELGFAEINRYTELELLLEGAVPTVPDPAVDVVTLEQRPELLRAAWELMCETWNDMPGEASVPSGYEAWKSRFDEGLRSLAGAFVALGPDGAPLGITITGHDDDHPGDAFTSYTAVVPAARGRGVAMALKLHQVRWCREAGYRRILTGNHEGNAPMLAINERLGFRVSKTILQLRCDVPSSS